MIVRKDFMLCPTGRGLAATRRPFGDAHLPVWHSTRTRISSHYQTTQHKNEVSTLSGDLTRWAVLFVRKVGCYVRLLEDRWGLCVAVLAAPFTHG